MTTIEKIIGKDKYIKADLQVKAKELNIKGISKMNIAELVDIIVERTNNPVIEEVIKKKQTKNKKKSIPKTIKNNIWNTYIGREKGIGECYCCFSEIDSKHFECGHVISESEGGEISVENLRPVCSLCNKSMGSTDMNLFKKSLKTKNPISIIRKILKEYEFIAEQPKRTVRRLYPCAPWVDDLNTGYTQDELVASMDYDNLIITPLTKLWCNEKLLNKLGEANFLDKYDIKKCILEKNNEITMLLKEKDTDFVLVDVFLLSELLKHGNKKQLDTNQ